MNDPSVLIIFTIVFVLLGLYNVNLGFRRIREARTRGQTVVWYRQINLLTGIEFILLTLVFLTSISIREKIIPSSLSGIVVPFYLGVLLITAVLAALVIRQSFSNARRQRGQTPVQTAKSNREDGANASEQIVSTLTPEERAAYLQRRRERRRNAAAARRRRAGKA